MGSTQNPTSFHISILSGVQGDTRRYRAFHLYEQLSLAGISTTLGHITSSSVIKSIQNVDILILQRVTWDPLIAQVIEEARSHGAIILADVDDLVFRRDSFQWIDSPDFADPIRAKLYNENLERNLLTLQHCDGIIVSTNYLADEVKDLGKPVWIHRNAFSLEMFYYAKKVTQSNQPGNKNIIVGYASGTPTHDRDFQLIQPILFKLLGEYPQLHLNLIGHLNKKYDWGKFADRIHYINFLPWRYLPRSLSQLSINLAPLRLDNPFSQSKSEIKYMEAALVKVPTIASPTEAFRYAISAGHNGFLAFSLDEWEVCLRKLIEDTALRHSIANNAYQDVLQRYAPWVRSEEAIGLINSILKTFRTDSIFLPFTKISSIDEPELFAYLWINKKIEKHPNLIERGLYTLRARGLITLLKEFWIFLRRSLSPIFPFKITR